MKKPPVYWPYFIAVGSAESGLIVRAEDLVAAGMLVGIGLATAENDYEGPRIRLTAKGRKVFEAPHK